MQPLKAKDTIKFLTITAIFNTIIALVLTYMVLEDHPFSDVFVISQIIGLSICLFVTMAGHFSDGGKWAAASLGVGLVAGIFSGSLLSWGFLFFSSREKIIESEKQIQKEKIKRLTMENQAAMTTLRLLQAQIEPHFLFNTLSNVISLFDIDMEKARTMLININEYLRISLQRTRQEMITLAQELDLTRQYLEIFKIRMGTRLSYEINDRTDQSDLPFPPLILQPLVENSIKYGLEPKIDGGTIIIDCRVQENMLEIVITDTGKGLDGDAGKAGIVCSTLASAV